MKMLMLHSAILLWTDCSRNNSKSLPNTSILHLDEGILLEIFDYLDILDLLRAGQVCQQWYRISRDYYLWKSLDLKTLRKPFSKDNSIETLFRRCPVSRLINLDLSGLQLTGRIFTTLAQNCLHLRKLVLNSTNFVAEETENDEEIFLFPEKLEYLDLRFSEGPARFYLTVSRYLGQVEWFGLCDAFIYPLYKDGSLDTTIMNMQNLKSLDTSHCLLAKDNLVSMVTSCRKLEVLSMRKCLCVRGHTLGELLSNCKSLRGLILDGTSVDDDVISSLPWEHTRMDYLELGWCPLVSTEGLRVVLDKLSRLKSLEYLGLCSTGDGKAISDVILEDLKKALSKGLFCSLRTLNITSSKKVTEKGLRSFIEEFCPNLEVKVGKCYALEGFSIQSDDRTWEDENNNNGPAHKKWKCNFRSKRSNNQMEQYFLESPL
ncbi:F-box/LRR-repeat protein 20-like [Actinia tenebrosa]|uniref:F-box/LRR-repeat protein 20-like n=1 Tax=Actinia tenebrosa TaxID=6105 RepID=A0A6P8I8A3_ACTTE|nr:F-box/LRR-repeat protein 20-like [Actinia tenebrosa]